MVLTFNLVNGHLLNKRQNHEEDCANFCGLLRKAKLYEFCFFYYFDF